jgi:hypothetical protein
MGLPEAFLVSMVRLLSEISALTRGISFSATRKVSSDAPLEGIGHGI